MFQVNNSIIELLEPLFSRSPRLARVPRNDAYAFERSSVLVRAEVQSPFLRCLRDWKR